MYCKFAKFQRVHRLHFRVSKASKFDVPDAKTAFTLMGDRRDVHQLMFAVETDRLLQIKEGAIAVQGSRELS